MISSDFREDEFKKWKDGCLMVKGLRPNRYIHVYIASKFSEISGAD